MSNGIIQEDWDFKSQNSSFDNQARILSAQSRTLRLIRSRVIGDHHGAQSEMADFLGVTPTSYNNYENNFPIPERVVDLLCEKIPYLKPEFIRRQETDRMTPAAMERLGLIKPRPPSQPSNKPPRRPRP